MALRLLSPFPAPAASVERQEPASPRAPSPLRAGWRRLKRVADWLEDNWLGDVLGTICLAVIFLALMFLPLVQP